MRNIHRFFVIICVTICTILVQAQNTDFDKAMAKLDAMEDKESSFTNAQQWLEYARAHYEVESVVSRDLSEGIEYAAVQKSLGKSNSSEELQINGQTYVKHSYRQVDIYVSKTDQIVRGWISKHLLDGEDYIDPANSLLIEVVEMDASLSDVVSKELNKLESFCVKSGNAAVAVGEYQHAAHYYIQAYIAQMNPAYKGDRNYDYLYVVPKMLLNDAANARSSELAILALEQLLDEGFHDNGNVQNYLSYYYYMQQTARSNNDLLWMSVSTACEGVALYPGNANLVDLAISLVAVLPSESDMSTMPKSRSSKLGNWIEMLLTHSPQNVGLWNSRGTLYYSLENYDEAIV